MNDSIRGEMEIIMNVDGIKGTEQTKILAVLSRLLKCEPYIDKIKNNLDAVVNSDKYTQADFTKNILSIIEINKCCNFYKEIDVTRMKYVIYGVLYNYFTKFQKEKAEKMDLLEFRLTFLNACDLILLIPETIKIKKEDCASCLGRTVECLKFLDKKTHL